MNRTKSLAILFLLAFANFAAAQQPLQIRVTLSPQLAMAPTSGRVMVFLSERNPRPMNGPNWFSPEPFFGIEVKDFGPGDSVMLDNSSDGCPASLDSLKQGQYTVQAVFDQDFYFANHAHGPGNVYSIPARVKIDSEQGVEVRLELTEVVSPDELQETEWFKYVELKSKLLADFHGREVVERAGVVLPPSYYTDTKRRYPVYYVITGFGGTLRGLQNRWAKGQPEAGEGETEFIRVYLTGQCKWGHHVYANSATNGPRGDAFVNEMIPLIDENFRTIAEPTARFVGGLSSGGWSSLWLQVTYPETFGGVWSTAPDPVDFRDWQGTNLYDAGGANVFFDAKQNKRPLARRGKTPVVWYRDFCKMDDVLGRGGQLRSFEAVFSPRGNDRQPVKCWDRETGKVDPEVVEYWKRYDISLTLEKNWMELSPKLAGKLHVYMGELDTFYLDGATKLLGQRLQKLGSDAVVEIFPGKDHGTLMTPELRQRILREMTYKFRQHHSE